ncbi:sodium- and chloride-dependent glycine transporter 1-like [Plakobranchus ocellatus]|uniref:Transporter n=1 Tax=Plakobranchus ocellatus TaxID=259542 RepID=A0AAV3Y7A2_9GAST|nr:sodium- and chloride-dependent glycine transporter 1-like [Plakobranchus ocellatus]
MSKNNAPEKVLQEVSVRLSGLNVSHTTEKKNRELQDPRSSAEFTPPGSPLDDDVDFDDGERENWSGKLDFLLSCIGFAVGLGNIWRFPYLCYSSGGGAFLFPYLTFLIVCALPLFFLETSYGQFSSLSPITVWRICPLFKGIGYGMVIISGIVCVYYNIIITWTFYYLFSSMQATLPWSTCGNWWNTPACVVPGATSNVSDNGPIENAMTASEEFWEFNLLQRTSGLENYGSIRWPLFGCLVLSWFLVFLCLCKGVQSSGKVVYVTATFPYLVLAILLGKGLTLPGAKVGIWWYLVPDWKKLMSFKVWGDAAYQIFFSVGMAWGSLITLSSYNAFNNNVFRDAMIVPCINCFTSVFAGLVIFSVLGFMSYTTGLPIDKVVTQGPGLIFIVYPEAVARLPFSHLWAIFFFLMIFTIGLDSQFGMFETMTSAFIDEYPLLLRHKKVQFTAFMCVIEFLLGIPMIFQGGFYLLTLMDWYSSCFSLMLLSLIESVIISWIYGVDRFMKDIELMIGHKPFCYWKYMWKYFTPAIVTGVWIFSLYQLKRVTLGSYEYPDWSIAMGWCLALLSILPVPIYAIYKVGGETEGTLTQKILKLIQPAVNFGPSRDEDRARYFASFDSFDWLRHEATKANQDWRTYQRKNPDSGKNLTSSNVALIQELTSKAAADGISLAKDNEDREDVRLSVIEIEMQYRLDSRTFVKRKDCDEEGRPSKRGLVRCYSV